MVYKTKKYKFAINVDEYGGRKKESVLDLLDLLKEEYSYLTQANRVIAKKRVLNAKKGELIIFGFSKKYDFRVVNEEEWEELSVSRRTPVVDLLDEWEEVQDLLQEYAVANYPNEADDDYYDDYRYNKKRKPNYCRNNEIIIYDDIDFDEIFIQQQPRKKYKTTTKRRNTYTNRNKKNNLGLEEVSVHHTHVKVGWDVFDIMLDNRDEEYVKVDGNIYWIDRDSSGNGKLSVK